MMIYFIQYQDPLPLSSSVHLPTIPTLSYLKESKRCTLECFKCKSFFTPSMEQHVIWDLDKVDWCISAAIRAASINIWFISVMFGWLLSDSPAPALSPASAPEIPLLHHSSPVTRRWVTPTITLLGGGNSDSIENPKYLLIQLKA